MDNIKKFEDFLDRLQGLLDSAEKQGHILVRVEDLENTFPELRESEDKKIRGAIIDHLKDYGLTEWAAWLEKQGEPTDINPSEFDLRLNKLLKQFETLPKEELASSLSFYLNVVQNDGTYKADEKQGVQKPANKVESKFHEGDWVVQENIGVYKVIEVCESWYEVVDNRDKHYSIGFDKEYMCHLYTIQDANDGDVLYSQTHHLIWIYKDSEHYHASINLNYADVVSFDSEIVVPSNVCPANRVQKSILFQKMEEAGYKWDAEKLELKKAEDEEYNGEDYGIDSLFHAQRILEKTLGKVDGYQSDEGILEHKCAISAVNKLYKRKPAEWSEEDEKMRNNLIRLLIRLSACTHTNSTSPSYSYPCEIDWLKSLGTQNHWKPTEEQVEALHDLKNLLEIYHTQGKDMY